MENNLIKLCYEDDGQVTNIRTYYIDEVIHFSLKDVLVVLNKENRKIDSAYVAKSMTGLLRAQLEALDDEEFTMLPVLEPRHPGEKEIFVTQPGMYRVLSSDRSSAGKRFQKWLFHEVVPSISKYGTYPPPLVSEGSSLSQMAEMLAQNSRVLADTIAKQELLESEVSNVRSDVDKVIGRIQKLEEDSSDFYTVMTVSQRLSELNFVYTSVQEYEVWCWCENITLSKSRWRSSKGVASWSHYLYPIETIDDAVSLLRESKGWFSQE